MNSISDSPPHSCTSTGEHLHKPFLAKREQSMARNLTKLHKEEYIQSWRPTEIPSWNQVAWLVLVETERVSAVLTETPCSCYAHMVYYFNIAPPWSCHVTKQRITMHVMWLSNCDLTLAISHRWIVFHVHHEDVEEVPFGGRVPPVQPVARKCSGFKSVCRKWKH